MTFKQLVSAEDFWMMPEVPGKRFELVNGEVVELSGTGARQGLISTTVASLLWTYAPEHRLGVCHFDGVGYILARHPDVVRVPDASFVARSRISEEGIPVGFWPFAPDLAVEIVSPNDRPGEVQTKVGEYLAAGSRAVWVMWPERRALTVHWPDGGSIELGPDDEIDEGDVLPGFRVKVGALFDTDA